MVRAGDDDGMSTMHEVKGSAFVTLARHVTAKHGEAQWQAVIAAIDPAFRLPVAEARPSDWFPEEAHVDVLRATHAVIAEGDVERFETLIAEATALGVQTFARAILAMSSPAFVIRRCPTLWGVIRRGPAQVAVDQSQGEGRSVLSYRRFPYFHDPLYRHYLRALLGAVVRPALGRTPEVRIVRHGKDELELEILH